MSKNIRLHISKPCHENWNEMTPAKQGRFCASCQKLVVDFSAMSDSQILAFFKQPIGAVCGRLAADQLDREIAIPPKHLPWIKYFFQITLPAFMLSYKATAQKKISGVPEVLKTQMLKGDTVALNTINAQPGPNKKYAINSKGTVCKIRMGDVSGSSASDLWQLRVQGKVTDGNGNPIAYATVIIKGTNHGTACDSAGRFELKPVERKTVIQVSAVGFKMKEVELNQNNLLVPLEPVVLEPVVVTSASNYVTGGLTGEVLVVRRYSKPIPVLQMIKDTITKRMKAFPNPVVAGAYVTLQWKNLPAGDYMLQLTDNNGKIIHKETVVIDDEITSLYFQVPQVSAGIYFIELTNAKGKAFREKLLVQ